MSGSKWQVEADLEVCEGHALCIDEAPDHLRMDGDLVAVVAPSVSDDDLPKARAAARVCPVAALRLSRAAQ